jgi:hypothetical protein
VDPVRLVSVSEDAYFWLNPFLVPEVAIVPEQKHKYFYKSIGHVLFAESVYLVVCPTPENTIQRTAIRSSNDLTAMTFTSVRDHHQLSAT